MKHACLAMQQACSRLATSRNGGEQAARAWTTYGFATEACLATGDDEGKAGRVPGTKLKRHVDSSGLL